MPRNRNFSGSVESYSHKAAKATLVSWFRDAAEKVGYDNYATACGVSWRVNRSAPNYGVWEEYPIIGDEECAVWDEVDDKYLEAPPTYKELCKLGTPPWMILDAAIQHKGRITQAFEVIHKSPPTFDKYRLLEVCDFETTFLDAAWILSQVKPPKKLKPARFSIKDF